MAPIKDRKRKSSTEHATSTPQGGAIAKSLKITQSQKQALIDNLQLEITERARKLRAQYGLQAQALRSRVEIRINRVPSALRRANMGQLLEAYLKKSDAANETAPVIRVSKTVARKPVATNTQQFESEKHDKPRGVKRSSDAIFEDKENAGEAAVAKKRAKANTAVSRQVTNPSTILSPKSSNSRTLPQSPIRPPFGSPPKANLYRPMSPLKPMSPAKAAVNAATASLASLVGGGKLKTTREAAGATTKAKPKPTSDASKSKRGGAAEAPRTVSSASNSSAMSGASTGTTVVKKTTTRTGATAVGVTAAARKTAAAAATTKKTTVAKVTTTAPATRSLRKRA